MTPTISKWGYRFGTPHPIVVPVLTQGLTTYKGSYPADIFRLMFLIGQGMLCT